jgi:hypothetical protein
MVQDRTTNSQKKYEEFLQHLEAVRQLQKDLMTYGLDAAYLYFEDVDGDWLETWGDDDDEPGYIESLTNFLESDDKVAVKVRQYLQDKSTSEIIEQLENCLCLLTEKDRLFALKDVLADDVNVLASKSNFSEKQIDEIDLLDLAEDLLEKLKAIFDEG